MKLEELSVTYIYKIIYDDHDENVGMTDGEVRTYVLAWLPYMFLLWLICSSTCKRRLVMRDFPLTIEQSFCGPNSVKYVLLARHFIGVLMNPAMNMYGDNCN